MTMKLSLSLLIALQCPTVLWARQVSSSASTNSAMQAAPTPTATAAPTTVQGTGTGSVPSSGTGLETSGRPSTTTPQPQSSSPSVRDSSKQSAGISMITSAVSGGVGAYMMVMGAQASASCPNGPQCPMAPMYYMMGAQALAQAAASMAQSKQASGTQAQVDWRSGGYDSGAGGTTYDDAIRATGVDPKQLESIQRNLTSANGLNGFKLSPDGKTLTTPDGKRIPTTTGTSAASLAGAGFSRGAIDGAMRAANKAEKAIVEKIGAHTAAAGFGEGSGSGGSLTAGMAASGSGSGGYGAAAGFGLDGAVRDPAAASVAGLTTEFNGEKIGVAQDQIFQMISRRYDHKMQREGEGFLPAAANNLPR